jgi:hypothetical protein
VTVRHLAALLVALLPLAARAGDNDLQLYRLGHPDDIVVCTKCDGTDRTVEPGDPQAQVRFARFASALGLALIPPMFEPGQTTGQTGFEVGFSGHVALQKLDPSEWPTAGTQAATAAPRALFLPTISMRKGFGGSVELGAAASFLPNSQIVALSTDLRWALVEGQELAGIVMPDLAVRVHLTRPVGTQELDLLAGGADAVLSYRVAIAGVVRLQPFVQGGIAMVNATTSVIAFHPQSQDVRDPTAADGVFHNINFFQNRYLRWAAGFRLVAGAVLVAVEGSTASGTNPVQTDSTSSGVAPPTQKTQSYAVSGRLGFAF